MRRTLSGVRSGTIARCPHPSTVRAPASWTTSSCCCPAPWHPAPTSTSRTPGSRSPCPPSSADAPEVELVDPEGLPARPLVPDGLTPLATPAYGPFRRLHLTPAQARRAVRRSARRPRRRPADRPGPEPDRDARRRPRRRAPRSQRHRHPPAASPRSAWSGSSLAAASLLEGSSPRRGRPAALARRRRLRPRARPGRGRYLRHRRRARGPGRAASGPTRSRRSSTRTSRATTSAASWCSSPASPAAASRRWPARCTT